MKPSEVDDQLAEDAADEAKTLVTLMRAALAVADIKDPDSLIVALTSMLFDAHVTAREPRTPVHIVGSFALAITNLVIPTLDVDLVPRKTVELLAATAETMMRQAA